MKTAKVHPDDVHLVRPGDWLCYDHDLQVYRLVPAIAARRRDEIAAAIIALIHHLWNPEA